MGLFDLFKKKPDVITKPVNLEYVRMVNDLAEVQYVEDPHKKEKMLLECEERYMLENNIVDLHFTYNFMIELYY